MSENLSPDPIISTMLRMCERKSMSYADIGRMCDVTRATAYSWFNHGASPTLFTVKRMADALGMELRLVRKTKPRRKATRKAT